MYIAIETYTKLMSCACTYYNFVCFSIIIIIVKVLLYVYIHVVILCACTCSCNSNIRMRLYFPILAIQLMFLLIFDNQNNWLFINYNSRS